MYRDRACDCWCVVVFVRCSVDCEWAWVWQGEAIQHEREFVGGGGGVIIGWFYCVELGGCYECS